MLVLNRKADERLVINEDIEITILKTRGNRVRLGLRAPRGVVIRRAEILTRQV